jgi:hypothetical protein
VRTNQTKVRPAIKRGPLEFIYTRELEHGGEVLHTFRLIDLDPAHASLMLELFGDFWERAPEVTIQWRLERMLREKRRRAIPRLVDATSSSRPLSIGTQEAVLKRWGRKSKSGYVQTAKSRARLAALSEAVAAYAIEVLYSNLDRRAFNPRFQAGHLANRFPRSDSDDTDVLQAIFRAEIETICGPPDVFAFTRSGKIPHRMFHPNFCIIA